MIIFAIFALVYCDVNFEDKIFKKFLNKYEKTYSKPKEFLSKFQNHKQIKFLNKFSNKNDITHSFEIKKKEKKKTNLNDQLLGAPNSFDWRDKNIIGPTGQESFTTSKWILPTFQMLESLYAKKKGKLENFSRQMIIDCNIKDTIEDTLDWVKKKGIMLEADYPYTGIPGTCKLDESKYIDMKVEGYLKLEAPANEEQIKNYLYEIGPLTIGINSKPLQTYSGGIIDLNSLQCPPKDINHPVILVGYGTNSGKDYWIIKNNWGRAWGESGYFRVARGKSVCGVNYYVVIPYIKFE